MEDQDIKLLDDYFNGLLPAADEAAVRARCDADAAFAGEFNLRRQMADWLHSNPARSEFRQQTDKLGAEFFKSAETRPMQPIQVVWRRRLMAAAAVLLLAIAAWWLLRPAPPLYQQYAAYTPLHLTERGATAPQATAAEAAFNRKDYQQALESLRQLVDLQPDNSTARLYMGISLLELNRPAEARNALSPLAEGQSVLRSDARWYVALSYLLEQDQAGCRKALEEIPVGDPHRVKADELLRSLK
jgi:predicted Zn-dependent protease